MNGDEAPKQFLSGEDAVEMPSTPFPLTGENVLILGRRGSEAHGTYLPPEDDQGTDDRDLMGIVVPPLDRYLGLRVWEGSEAIKGQWDVVLYEVRKFVSLLCRQNPNVLSLLWLDPLDYLHLNYAGSLLLKHRHLFRSRRAAFMSFTGYANHQLKRMTHFDAKMHAELSAVEAEMERRGINMQNPKPRVNPIPNPSWASGYPFDFSDDVLIAERRKLKGKGFSGYMGEKRRSLVKKFGYDTKNAAHLLRLLCMGTEYLATGALCVRRQPEECEMLIDVKRGKYSLIKIQEMADREFVRCNNAMDRSVLPEGIDHDAVNALTGQILMLTLKLRDDA